MWSVFKRWLFMANGKIIEFPKKTKFNLVYLALIAMVIYIGVNVYGALSKGHINRFEVKDGSLVKENRFNALVIRDEEVVVADETGYVNYFITQGDRGAAGNLIYTVDETGTVIDYVNGVESMNGVITEDELAQLEEMILAFKDSYNMEDFHKVSSSKQKLTDSVTRMVNENLLNEIQKNPSLEGSINYKYMSKAGVVSYWKDGYEQLSAEKVTSSCFGEDYKKEVLENNKLVASGESVYKISDDENWSVAFIAEEEVAQYLLEKEVVEVRFIQEDVSFWGSVSVHTNSLSEKVVELSFSGGGINFIDDRFVDIELSLGNADGLKIPRTAIVEKEFYIVPKEYVFYNKHESYYFINVEKTLENGEKTVFKNEVHPYYQDADTQAYYLEEREVKLGDRLFMENSPNEFVVSNTGILVGVYNINKGYADFKQIKILDQNEDYAIVKSNTKYGLSAYDFIVLDAGDVAEDTFIN